MNESTLKINRVDILASDNVNANNQGTLAVIPAGKTVNIDLKMLDDNFLSGIIMHTLRAQFGDYINLQIVDVDNILGSKDPILEQHYTNWYMKSDSQEQLNEKLNYPTKILAGLYLRLIYHSFGSDDITVAVNYRLHKALY